MTDDDDGAVITRLNDLQLQQLRKLLTASGDIACARIRDLAGKDFLDKLLADQAGEIVVQVALKGGLVRVNVNWPEFSTKVETVCELVVHRDNATAS